MFGAIENAMGRLKAAYSAPERGYHGQRHIDGLISELSRLRGLFHRPDAVELACWYHDAVYDPLARDNEARSAALMWSELGGLADDALLAWATTLILATSDHRLPSEIVPELARDCALFLDMDMSILGAATDDYDRYAAGVKHEFLPHFGEAPYRARRADFLRMAQQNGPIFLTPEFAHLEPKAAANMRRELASLGG